MDSSSGTRLGYSIAVGKRTNGYINELIASTLTNAKYKSRDDSTLNG